MGTNKHKRSSERKTKTIAAKEEKTEEESYDVPTPRSLATGSMVTTPQLNSIIMIAISFQYLWQMRHVLYESKDCNAYLHPSVQQETEGDSCSHTDLLLLMAKLHSGYISEILVGLIIVFLCWSETALLLQFQAILCTSPLLTSVIALQLTKDMIDPSFAGKLGMMITTLLVLTAASLYGAKNLSPRQPLKVDVLNATLLTIMVAFAWETYKFISTGPSGLVHISQEPSTASLALMAFLAVDQATLIGICIFGIVFLPDSSKRYLLGFIAASHLLSHIYFMPKIRADLSDPEYYENMMLGIIMFTSTASVAPSISLFEIKTASQEETEAA